jgi:hypothetical protein
MKRKLKLKYAEFDDKGVLVRCGGHYVRYEEPFYDVEEHFK